MAQIPEVNTKIENLPIDLNVNELQAQGGYVSTFLNEHMMIMGAMTNPAEVRNRIQIVTMAIELNVSLITDDKIRDNLWEWYKKECDVNTKENMGADDSNMVRYNAARLLLGKVMSFVGRHLSKPVEIGTE